MSLVIKKHAITVTFSEPIKLGVSQQPETGFLNAGFLLSYGISAISQTASTVTLSRLCLYKNCAFSFSKKIWHSSFFLLSKNLLSWMFLAFSFFPDTVVSPPSISLQKLNTQKEQNGGQIHKYTLTYSWYMSIKEKKTSRPKKFKINPTEKPC